jgi:hypothetical protein
VKVWLLAMLIMPTLSNTLLWQNLAPHTISLLV